ILSDSHQLSVYFFFSSRRRHTRSKRDWSSDVCSSDLHSASASDVSRICFQICVGAPAPYITPPQALLIAEALSAAPTHTADANWGVEPIIHVSLFRPVSPNW